MGSQGPGGHPGHSITGKTHEGTHWVTHFLTLATRLRLQYPGFPTFLCGHHPRPPTSVLFMQMWRPIKPNWLNVVWQGGIIWCPMRVLMSQASLATCRRRSLKPHQGSRSHLEGSDTSFEWDCLWPVLLSGHLINVNGRWFILAFTLWIICLCFLSAEFAKRVTIYLTCTSASVALLKST